MERKSEAEIAVSMTRQIDGVVAVVNKLTFRLDDSHLRPDEAALHGVTDDLTEEEVDRHDRQGAGRLRDDERIDRADRRGCGRGAA
jgi:hypothetical protein